MTTADPRDHLVLVLDIDRLDDALAYARTHVAVVRHREDRLRALRARPGPEAFEALHHKGFRVFADLKLHDIPTTVERGARAIGRHGVDFLNFHAAGGVDDVARRASTDCARARATRDITQPIALAVTVLTSDANVDALEPRMEFGRDAGCDGVVCAGPTSRLRARRRLRTMVPGIRLPGGDAHDQARVDTPGDAIARGADWLVVGRAVAAADDPERAAEEITRDVAAALGRTLGLTGCTKNAPAYTERRLSSRRSPDAVAPCAHPRAAPGCTPEGGGSPPSTRGGEGEAQAGLARSRRSVRPGHARRRAREAQGRERARVAARCRQGAGAPDHGRSSTSARAVGSAGSAATSAKACSCHPKIVARGLIWQFSSSSSARRGSARAPSSASSWNVTRRSGSRCRPRRARRGRARSTVSTTGSSTPAEFEALRRAGGLARVVRGLRSLVRHPAGARWRNTWRPGEDVLLEIDVQGALAARTAVPRRAAGVRQAAVTRGAAPAPRGARRATTRPRSSAASPRRRPRRPKRASSTSWW